MPQPKDKDGMNGYKNNTPICCLQETHLKTRDTYRLKVKGWKKIFHANRDQKKAGVATLISDKIDFKTKAVKRDKEGHYIMIKGSIQEGITIINIYALNIVALQYVRQMLTSMKGEINNNTITVRDFNTTLTPMDRSTKQKISKITQTLNDTMDQLDLIDIYRTFHPKTISPFSQVRTETSPGWITSWAINLALVNSEKLKSFQASLLITMWLD